MPKLWRGVRSLFARVSSFVRGKGFAQGVYAAAYPGSGSQRMLPAPSEDENERPTV
jgi:hypothetical protein